jgi:hypothetical protein
MRNQSRREFVCRTIPAALAAGSALALGPFRNAIAAQIPTATQPYTGARLALQFDGQFAGWLKSASGGHALGDVVTEGATVNGIQRKHIASLKYEDIVLTCGTGMSPSLYDWIKGSFDRQLIPKSGSIVTCNFNGQAQYQHNWYKSIISEIGFPACDVTSRAPSGLMLNCTPEYTSLTKANGAALPGAPTAPARNQLWLSDNFRLRITGLDCSGVTKIEAITYKSAPNQNAVGTMRMPIGTPSVMQVPSLVVTLPEAQAAGFFHWFQASVVQGNAASDPGRTGLLEYLVTGTGGSLFSLEFLGLALQKLMPITASAGQLPSVKAVMYCKGLRFGYSAAACA